MRVEWAVACYETGFNENQQFVMIEPHTETSPVEGFPCEEAFIKIAASLACSYEETRAVGSRHALSWQVRDPNGEIVLEGSEPFELLEPSAWHHEGFDGRVMWPLRLAFTAPIAGPYEIALAVDDGEPFVLRHYFALLTDLL